MGGLIPRCIPIPRQIEKILLMKASQKANNKETFAKRNEQQLTTVKDATHFMYSFRRVCLIRHKSSQFAFTTNIPFCGQWGDNEICLR